jgi:transposase
MTKKYAQVNND